MKSFYLFMLFSLLSLAPSCLLAEVEIQLIDWPNKCVGPGGGFPCGGDIYCNFDLVPPDELNDYADFQVGQGNAVLIGSWQNQGTWDCDLGAHYWTVSNAFQLIEHDNAHYDWDCRNGGVISTVSDRLRYVTFGSTATSCTSQCQ